jgi:hypothetical protein
MNVAQLINVLSAMDPEAGIYLQMVDESDDKTMDPSLLQDINEVVIDIEDHVIIIRTVNRN